MYAPKIAALLSVVGVIGLLTSAFIGVNPPADYILDAVQVCFALAAILLLGYVAAGIVLDARAPGTK
jgi:hypothetical protein